MGKEPLSAAHFKEPGPRARRKKIVPVEPKQSASRLPVRIHESPERYGHTKPHKPDQGEW